jgi:hypothetical protein
VIINKFRFGNYYYLEKALALLVLAGELVSVLVLADCEYYEGSGGGDGVSGAIPSVDQMVLTPT